jgi:HEAT repeat protein
MFAARVGKAQIKVGQSATSRAQSQRSVLTMQPFGGGAVEQACMLRRNIGNQAKFRILAERGLHSADEASAQGAKGMHKRAATTPDLDWDLGKIPAFSADGHRLPMSLPPPPAPPLQTKLVVGQVNDRFENEADRIADQVLAAPAHPAVSGAPPLIQRFSGQSNGQIDSAPDSVGQALACPGAPLEPTLRQDMERRFGRDFSHVRVHTDTAADQSARDVNANAYTIRHDIVFGAGRFAPWTSGGRRLIAHELAHVVQQQASRVSIQRQPVMIPPPPADPVYQQDQIINETFVPAAIMERRENLALTQDQQEDLLVRRKLEAIAELAKLKNDDRAAKTLVLIVEDKLHAINRLRPPDKLAVQQDAVEALGKIGSQVALSKLNDLLNSKDPKERMLATRGFSTAVGGQAAAALLTRLSQETNADIKFEIISDLGKIGSGLASVQEKETIVKALIREMENNTGEVFRVAIRALGKLQLKSATEALLKQLKLFGLSISSIGEDIIRALGEIGDDRAVELLVIMLEKHGSKFVRSEAAIALGKIGGSKALAALKNRLNQEKEDSVKADISKALNLMP